MNRYAFLIWIISLVLYIVTLCPVTTWGDSAKLATFSAELKVDIDSGVHNLRNIIGYIFNALPFADISYKQNLLSAIFGSFSCLVLFLIVFEITNRILPAVVSAFALMISHTHWHLSVITESYTLLNFLFLLSVYLLLLWTKSGKKFYLLVAGFVAGLEVFNNIIILWFIPFYFIFIFLTSKKEQKISLLDSQLSFIFGLLIGLLPSILLFLSFTQKIGFKETFNQFFQIHYSQYLFVYHPLSAIIGTAKYFIYLLYQFPLVGFILGFIGAYKLHKSARPLFFFILIIFLINILVTSTYMVQRRFYMMTVSFSLFSIFIGCGFNYIYNKIKKFHGVAIFIIVILLPAILYNYTPEVSKQTGVKLFVSRRIELRDEENFFLKPWKNKYTSARDFAIRALAATKNNSILIVDFTPLALLNFYQKVENVRPDVILTNIDTISKNFYVDYIKTEIQLGRNVYIVGGHPVYQEDTLKKYFELIKTEVLYEVKF